MRKLAALAVITVFTSLSAFGQSRELRNVGFYDEIKVSHGIEVILTDGEPGEIRVSARGVDLDDVLTDVSWETLKIRFRNVSIWSDEKFDRRNITVEVPVKELESIEVNTGAIIESQHIIRSNELRIESSTGGEAELTVDVDDLRVEFNMGSVAKIAGKAKYLQCKSNMGAVVNLSQLDAQYGTLKANMGGELKASLSREVDASAGMGGVIVIYGNPDKQYTSDSFGGVISFKGVSN